MPPTPYETAWAARHAEWKRSSRRFNIMDGLDLRGHCALVGRFHLDPRCDRTAAARGLHGRVPAEGLARGRSPW
jgi:hypothetical protein